MRRKSPVNMRIATSAAASAITSAGSVESLSPMPSPTSRVVSQIHCDIKQPACRVIKQSLLTCRESGEHRRVEKVLPLRGRAIRKPSPCGPHIALQLQRVPAQGCARDAGIRPKSVGDPQGRRRTHALPVQHVLAKHYFCKHCGAYPFHQTRSDPQLWRANIGCREVGDPYTLVAGLVDGASLSLAKDA